MVSFVFGLALFSTIVYLESTFLLYVRDKKQYSGASAFFCISAVVCWSYVFSQLN